eukprot:TRINITY_DN110455_c0_g1_i1.p1 TRINITY_DN110455_c0_g1~~TRINITY_DN110455_c0_g1_i1.p1  ORF type:complete len:424 (+),score=80.14 TRINITY_DN110455_c0_g1_i1:106-1377(+)
MGNSSQSKPASASDETWIMEAMTVLADGRRSQAERRPYFDRLRAHFVPAIQRTPAFAEELRRVFALRFDRWPIPPYSDASESRKKQLADCIRGCLFGAALGDAAGLATEFLDKATASQHYGEAFNFIPSCEVYADTHRLSFPPGDWTDDTDQQILILQSLLGTKGQADAQDFAKKLVSWKDKGFPGLGDSSGCGLGASTKAVISKSGFLEDPIAQAHAVWEGRGGLIAANGAVMRTAVTGIPFFWDLDMMLKNTQILCKTTHADPRCLASCVAVASSVAFILQARADSDTAIDCSDIVARALTAAEAFLDSPEQRQELREHATCSLSELRLDDARSIGYTFKCMGAGMWAFINAEKLGFIGTMNSIISEAGDADTNATVAGALLGCLFGYSKLPAEWINKMPYAQWLEAWVQKLLFMLDLPVS